MSEIENRNENYVKISKEIYLTDTRLPEGSVDVSFIRIESPELFEVYTDENTQEYHITIGITKDMSLESLMTKITELKYLIIGEEIAELHVDHDSCIELTGFPRKSIEKLWKDNFCHSNIRIYLHEKRRMIPREEEIRKILEENHDSLIGGHGGVKKTYYRIIANYFWKTVRKDVETYVKNYVICQRNKVNRHPTKMPMIITDFPNKFNDKIAIDICGPFPITKNRNKYILTIQDCLTKYFMGIPIEDFTAITVIRELLEKYISYFGIPRNILTDRGTNFTSDLMKTFEKMMGIKPITTTSFHPQSNGSLERTHQVLKDYLRHFANDNADDWDEKIHLANLYFNTSKHESTGYTPYELVFGNKANDLSSMKKNLNVSYFEYLEELQSRITRNLNETKETLLKSKQETKERYDRMVNPQEFQPNDLVWLCKESNSNDRTNTLNIPFEGPFRVIEKVSDVNYKIQKNRKEIVVHANRLKYANINLFQISLD
ncbi:hypothetical protein PV328_012013 [Microctonus aethiopoides]|uniref:RNA-directed DNA polymerase n=1 Tax=Microctonus aethiopoides TaxID=144406 RepID=A0AA39KPU1_9HYME|nr:hypothetical protein PV328_012013 [Microctonus aethiopoides]